MAEVFDSITVPLPGGKSATIRVPQSMSEQERQGVVKQFLDERTKFDKEDVPASGQDDDGIYTGAVAPGNDDDGDSGLKLPNLRAGFQGLTFGFGDEIVAGGAASLNRLTNKDPGKSWSELYDAYLARERQSIEGHRDKNPAAAFGSEIAGGIAPGVVAAPAALLRGGASLLGSTAKSVGLGAGGGAVYGFGSGEGGDRARSAGTSAGFGALFGGAAPLAGTAIKKAGQGLARRAGERAARATAPQTDELFTAARASLANAKGAGAKVPGSEVVSLLNATFREFSDDGFDEVLHPGMARVLGRAGRDFASPSVDAASLITLRQRAAQVAKQTNEGRPTPDAAFATRFIEKLDDMIEGGQGQLFNKRREFSGEFREFRKLYSAARKSSLIEDAIDKASRQASGFENGLRIQFRRILDNKKLRRGFSMEELSAMQRVADGNFTRNTLRRIGRMSFGSGVQHNMLQGIGGATASGILAGMMGADPLVGAAVGAGFGYGAQKLAERGTRRAAESARAVTALGGTPMTRPLLTGRLPQGLLLDAAPVMGDVSAGLLYR